MISTALVRGSSPIFLWSTSLHDDGLPPTDTPHLAVLSVLNSTRSVPGGILRDSNTAAAAESTALLQHSILPRCTLAPATQGSTACTSLWLPFAKRAALLVQSRAASGSAFRHTSPVMLLSCGVSTTRAGPAAEQGQTFRAEARQQWQCVQAADSVCQTAWGQLA